MTDSVNDFTLQRMLQLEEEMPGLLLERDLAIVKRDFPTVLDVRKDSLVGRGHHESYHLYVPTRRIICFLWDEDRDERVFLAADEILSKLNLNGKGLILMFGERKGTLTVVTTNDNAKESLELTIPNEITTLGDTWIVNIATSGADLAKSGIINDDVKISEPYLRNLLETRSSLERVWNCLELRDLEVRARQKKM